METDGGKQILCDSPDRWAVGDGRKIADGRAIAARLALWERSYVAGCGRDLKRIKFPSDELSGRWRFAFTERADVQLRRVASLSHNLRILPRRNLHSSSTTPAWALSVPVHEERPSRNGHFNKQKTTRKEFVSPRLARSLPGIFNRSAATSINIRRSPGKYLRGRRNLL